MRAWTLALLFGLGSASAQPLPYEAKATHLGVVNCANSLCHGSVTTWKPNT